MKILTPILLPLLLFSHCQSQEGIQTEKYYECAPQPYQRILSQNELTNRFDDNIIKRLAMVNVADDHGAMGRNKEGYFHVRFQMGVSHLLNYAIKEQHLEALKGGVRAMEYSFQYQLFTGDFELKIPPELSHLMPTEGDRTSGVAFFASALGSGLLALQESVWFQNQASQKRRVKKLHDQIRLTLDFLKRNENQLKQNDITAPNRLLFDAVAFYSLGRYFKDQESISMGVAFAELALARQSENGFFIEKGGWDSSYQAVALENGFRLLSILDKNSPFSAVLYQKLTCGAEWLTSRILPTGQISTEGNTRVFKGGEVFLGKEKGMAFKSAVMALFATYHYTDEEKYSQLANKILFFYL